MKTLFDPATQVIQLGRLNLLTAASSRLWGKMSVSQMFKHLTKAFLVPTGKLKLPKDKLFYIAANPISRWLMIEVAPKWPKNMATVDAFIIKEDPDFETAKQELLSAMEGFLKASSFHGSHPAFGVMSKELWGKAMFMHLDHHLKQFNV